MSTPLHSVSLVELHARFLNLVPRIVTHGLVYFRHVKSLERKEDLIAEMVALCWKWFLRLIERGKDPLAFASALASFAARSVRGGRRVTGMDKAKDVLSPRAQQLHGFAVEKLPDYSTLAGTPLEEALVDNTRTPIPEQVSFRCDFPRWRRMRTERDRRVIDELMRGERTMDVARRLGISSARISQLRRDFQADWDRFCSECVSG